MRLCLPILPKLQSPIYVSRVTGAWGLLSLGVEADGPRRPNPRTRVGRVCRYGHAAHGEYSMNRDQLLQRLRSRARRVGPAELVWWNGELIHVSEAMMRTVELPVTEHIQARGDDVVIMRHLEAA